jgi:hypothetical protein
MQHKTISPEQRLLGNTNPYKRANYVHVAILSSKKRSKKYIYIYFFSFEKGFCIIDYHLDNR